jgi:hypothetical protein
MAKGKKKSAEESSQLFHNIMGASVKGNSKPAKKPTVESQEFEMGLPDGTKAYILETEWRGYKRYFFDTTSKKYPAFSVTFTDEESTKDKLSFNQYTLLNHFLKGLK